MFEEETVMMLVYDENAENSFDWGEMDIEDYVDIHALFEQEVHDDY